ncbi:MAG: hypothetical protein JWM05_175 [Acidimicrobiales bacterium]|nr:hypothetical protein [Acidimicrobiales bacterium]
MRQRRRRGVGMSLVTSALLLAGCGKKAANTAGDATSTPTPAGSSTTTSTPGTGGSGTTTSTPASGGGSSTTAPPSGGGGVGGTGLGTTAKTPLGDVVVDGSGRTLYGFVPDKAKPAPTCKAACAKAWPPAAVPGGTLPSGLDPKVFSVVARADGTKQLKVAGWYAYTYAGDAGPGDVNGQGSGGQWYAISPTGTLVRSAGGPAPGGGTGATSPTSRPGATG